MTEEEIKQDVNDFQEYRAQAFYLVRRNFGLRGLSDNINGMCWIYKRLVKAGASKKTIEDLKYWLKKIKDEMADVNPNELSDASKERYAAKIVETLEMNQAS